MRSVYLSLLVILFLLSFNGCATTARKTESSVLSNKIGDLESRMSSLEKGQKQLEKMVVNQMSLQEEVVKSGYVKGSSTRKVIANPSKKDIQVALKNAGFYIGEIDGKIGPKTTQAIMDFQKENGLKVDGIAGSNTWEVLGQFCDSE